MDPKPFNQVILGQLATIANDYWQEIGRIFKNEQSLAAKLQQPLSLANLKQKLEAYKKGYVQQHNSSQIPPICDRLNNSLFSLAQLSINSLTANRNRSQFLQAIVREMQLLKLAQLQNKPQNALDQKQLQQILALAFDLDLINKHELQLALRQIKFDQISSPFLIQLQVLKNDHNYLHNFQQLWHNLAATSLDDLQLAAAEKISLLAEIANQNWSQKNALKQQNIALIYEHQDLLMALKIGLPLDEEDKQKLTALIYELEDENLLTLVQEAINLHNVLRCWLNLDEQSRLNFSPLKQRLPYVFAQLKPAFKGSSLFDGPQGWPLICGYPWRLLQYSKPLATALTSKTHGPQLKIASPTSETSEAGQTAQTAENAENGGGGENAGEVVAGGGAEVVAGAENAETAGEVVAGGEAGGSETGAEVVAGDEAGEVVAGGGGETAETSDDTGGGEAGGDGENAETGDDTGDEHGDEDGGGENAETGDDTGDEHGDEHGGEIITTIPLNINTQTTLDNGQLPFFSRQYSAEQLPELLADFQQFLQFLHQKKSLQYLLDYQLLENQPLDWFNNPAQIINYRWLVTKKLLPHCQKPQLLLNRELCQLTSLLANCNAKQFQQIIFNLAAVKNIPLLVNQLAEPCPELAQALILHLFAKPQLACLFTKGWALHKTQVPVLAKLINFLETQPLTDCANLNKQIKYGCCCLYLAWALEHSSLDTKLAQHCLNINRQVVSSLSKHLLAELNASCA